jgi:thioesterase domain-containing protein
VALYRATPHDSVGFLDRWLPWVPAWRHIFKRLDVLDVKTEHAAIFHERAATTIGPHLAKLLDDLASEKR